ncbi:LuxR C-terminal-related transcriptional regulator [Streptomyces sp. NPDC055681]
MTRLLVIGDQALKRQALAMVLRAGSLTLVGQSHPACAISRTTQLDPDIVVWQLEPTGLAPLRRLLQNRARRCRVLVLTDDDVCAYASLRAGADGALGDSVTPDQLRAAISALITDGAVLAPHLTSTLIETLRSRPRLPDATTEHRLATLTMRECQVLAAMARGWNNVEIADRLHLAPATVKSHVGHILRKTGARDRLQAVVLALLVGVLRQRI